MTKGRKVPGKLLHEMQFARSAGKAFERRIPYWFLMKKKQSELPLA